MQRTKSSRNKPPWQMRSGNSPMQGKFGDFLKKAIAGPAGMVSSLFGGGGGGGTGGGGGAISALGAMGNPGEMLKRTKFGKKHALIHSADDSSSEDISANAEEEVVEPDLAPTALSKKYKYTKK